MRLKEFLEVIETTTFEYIEIDSKDGLTRDVFNLSFGSSSLIPYLDCDICYIFYDKNRPMYINIGLYTPTSLVISFNDPFTHTSFVKSYEEVEKIKGVIKDNRGNSFLMFCLSLSDAVTPSSGYTPYTTEDSIYTYYVTPDGGVKKKN